MVITGDEETVRDGFWPKLAKVLANIPFAEDAVAAYYCAFDSRTPLRVKGTLLAALVYFIMIGRKRFRRSPHFYPRLGAA